MQQKQQPKTVKVDKQFLADFDYLTRHFGWMAENGEIDEMKKMDTRNTGNKHVLHHGFGE